jgi:hypothetical protein
MAQQKACLKFWPMLRCCDAIAALASGNPRKPVVSIPARVSNPLVAAIC